MRRCARPGCSRPATVVLRIDATGRQALFVSLTDDPFDLGNALCDLHADSTSVPRGWTFTDGREDQTSMLAGNRTKPLADAPAPSADSDSRTAGGPRRPHRPQRRRPRDAQPGLFADTETGAEECGEESEEEAGSDTAGRPDTPSATEVGLVTAEAEGITGTQAEDQAAAPATAPGTGTDETEQERPQRETPEDETGVFQRFADSETSEDLDAILDADSPLLSRAFRGVRSEED